MLNALYVQVETFLRSERGATAVEYGVMVALIGFTILLVVSAFGLKVADIYKDIYQTISTGNQVQP